MIEDLFGYVPPGNNNQNKRDSSALEHAPQLIQIIEPKKAQNLAILLKASGVTMEEICDALKQGDFTIFRQFSLTLNACTQGFRQQAWYKHRQNFFRLT